MPDGHDLLEVHLVADNSTARIVVLSTEQRNPSLVVALGLVCGTPGHLHVKWVSRVEVTTGRKRHILCLSADSFICVNQWPGVHGALDGWDMLMWGAGAVRRAGAWVGSQTCRWGVKHVGTMRRLRLVNEGELMMRFNL